jgi:hypothetical protein
VCDPWNVVFLWCSFLHTPGLDSIDFLNHDSPFCWKKN